MTSTVPISSSTPSSFSASSSSDFLSSSFAASHFSSSSIKHSVVQDFHCLSSLRVKNWPMSKNREKEGRQESFDKNNHCATQPLSPRNSFGTDFHLDHPPVPTASTQFASLSCSPSSFFSRNGNVMQNSTNANRHHHHHPCVPDKKSFDDCSEEANLSSAYSASSTEEEDLASCNNSISKKRSNNDYNEQDRANHYNSHSSVSPSINKRWQIRQRMKLRHEVGKVLQKSSFLTTRDGNRQLMRSVLKDRKILRCLSTDDTQTLNRSCELGKSLSFLVQDKAKKLNAAAYPLIVSSIIELYRNVCYSEVHQKEDCRKSVDFVKLSRMYGNAIHTNRLLFDGFDCSNFSLTNFSRDLDSQANARRRRCAKKSRNLSESCTRLTQAEAEVDEMGEEFDSLTSRQAKGMYEKLRKLTNISPLNFWAFVIDPRGMGGFQNSCRNIFLMTLLARRGMVKFSWGSRDGNNNGNKRSDNPKNSICNSEELAVNTNETKRGILLVQAVCDETETNDGGSASIPLHSSFSSFPFSSPDKSLMQAEAILSGWSFDFWFAFCNALKADKQMRSVLNSCLHDNK